MAFESSLKARIVQSDLRVKPIRTKSNCLNIVLIRCFRSIYVLFGFDSKISWNNLVF